MLSTTAKYVYTVYQFKSVSLAAQALFISQPALSRAIKKAENDFGAPIFNRKTLPFSLTVEGKLYIESIEKMMKLEKETAEKISDIHHAKGGSLRIATSTLLSHYVIPKILRVFQNQYPQVDVHIIMTSTDKLYEHLEKKMADVIFLSAESVPGEYCEEQILAERFVVAVPSNKVSPSLLPFAIEHEALICGDFGSKKEITDLSVFNGIEFIYNPPNTNIHKKRKDLFGSTDIHPYITSNAERQQFNYNLTCSGFGALLTTDANIATMRPNENCKYFVIGGAKAKRNFSVVYPKTQADHFDRIVQDFVNTAKQLFSVDHPLKQLANN